MERKKALEILTSFIKNQNLIRHHLAAEAAMRGIASKLTTKDPSINIDQWGIVGLLHDADYEITKDEPQKHTAVLEEKIGKELDPKVLYAIKSHAYKYNAHGVEPKSLMDWAIYTCDELTGFIVACALVTPDKKLLSVDVHFVLRKMKNVGFAKSVNREQIKMCEERLGILLDEFIQITLTSMQKISNEIGL